MLREKIALSLIIAIIVAALINIAYMTKLAEKIISGIDDIENLSHEEQFDSAEAIFNKTLELWNKNKVYTGIFLRHPEIDSTYDCFYDILAEVQKQEKDSIPALCEKLRYHIRCIVDMEKITLRSIL